ncbi:hypothetical protein [uncultured Desulfobacter sp.]|uniref:hypothetical protein n=1 Tax=uncultured Desulfobacter sp. TaxID=240139 RepID=UPI003749EC36
MHVLRIQPQCSDQTRDSIPYLMSPVRKKQNLVCFLDAKRLQIALQQQKQAIRPIKTSINKGGKAFFLFPMGIDDINSIC